MPLIPLSRLVVACLFAVGSMQAETALGDNQVTSIQDGMTGFAEWVGGLIRPSGPGSFNPEWYKGYRHVWAVPLSAQWCAMRLWPELKTAWDNPVFDEYFVRYMKVEEEKEWKGDAHNGLRKRPLYRDLYLMHRAAIDGAVAE